MKTQQWIQPVVMQARIDPAEGQTGVTRTNPPGRAARGILTLTLLFGGLGAEAAATLGHGPGNQVSAQHAGDIRPGADAHLARYGHVIRNPWMY